MTTIAIDRFRGIVAKPFGVTSRPVVKIIIIWLLAFLCSMPIFSMVMIPEYFSDTNIFAFRIIQDYAWNDTLIRIRIFVLLFAQFLLPLIVTAFAYFKVMNAVKKRPIIETQPASHRMKLNRQKVKLIRMFALIVGLFMLAWLPLHLGAVYTLITGAKMVAFKHMPTSLLFCSWLVASTSCFNPIIYFWFHKQFRLQAKNTWNRITFSK
ncbi:hypothetical protein B4U80_14087 [Leptotrombidium deliense]|uniref:G-protein coupled receptors family 1 profile domain-containing protein n=1 Tax=Leptotrombidium deliense TaxID=299467 RepID=A0A443S2Y2_9ACAR|nr:hypothetical protein B4U80_14087 [Leptotrombidium deliense]